MAYLPYTDMECMVYSVKKTLRKPFFKNLAGLKTLTLKTMDIVDAWVRRNNYIFTLGPTSTILVPTGDQYPAIHLTQSFWMAMASPILVVHQI